MGFGVFLPHFCHHSLVHCAFSPADSRGAYLPKRQKETKKILYYGEWAVGRDDVGKTL